MTSVRERERRALLTPASGRDVWWTKEAEMKRKTVAKVEGVRKRREYGVRGKERR